MSVNKNRVIGGFEDAVERGQTTVKNSAKQGATDFAKSAKGQITGGQINQAPADQGTNEQNSVAQQKMSDDDAKKFLQDLYGKSDKSDNNKSDKPANSGPVTQALGIPQNDPNAGKTPEEIAKLEALRDQLHQDYYQNLVSPPKPKEEPVTEKLEKEEQMEALEEEKKQKEKPGPLQNVKQGTGEIQPGVSG